MDREAWHAAFHGVSKSRTRLSNRTELLVYVIYCNRIGFLYIFVIIVHLLSCVQLSMTLWAAACLYILGSVFSVCITLYIIYAYYVLL